MTVSLVVDRVVHQYYTKQWSAFSMQLFDPLGKIQVVIFNFSAFMMLKTPTHIPAALQFAKDNVKRT